MKVLISHLKGSGDKWEPDPESPVALLEIGETPNWTIFAPHLEEPLKQMFAHPVRHDVNGCLETPEPFSADALQYIFTYDLPALGLGANLLVEE